MASYEETKAFLKGGLGEAKDLRIKFWGGELHGGF
jgi:hypothetical protein